LAVPIKKEEDEEESEDDEEALAAQRAEFMATFGISLQAMVDMKADEEFFDKIEKYVVFSQIWSAPGLPASL
jgi:hypothetical protein